MGSYSYCTKCDAGLDYPSIRERIEEVQFCPQCETENYPFVTTDDDPVLELLERIEKLEKEILVKELLDRLDDLENEVRSPRDITEDYIKDL